MLDMYLYTKFGVNPLDGFSEKGFHGRMDDGHARHDSRSAVQYHKADWVEMVLEYGFPYQVL